MRTIKCHCGQDILVDDQDYELFKHDECYCSAGAVYIRSRLYRLHHYIMGIPDGFEIDHRNRNFHDNQRHNLRAATRSQNMANVGLRKDNSLGYKGVRYGARSYGFRIERDGKEYSKYGFQTAKEAALAYNVKAKELFGEFAYQNEL